MLLLSRVVSRGLAKDPHIEGSVVSLPLCMMYVCGVGAYDTETAKVALIRNCSLEMRTHLLARRVSSR